MPLGTKRALILWPPTASPLVENRAKPLRRLTVASGWVSLVKTTLPLAAPPLPAVTSA